MRTKRLGVKEIVDHYERIIRDPSTLNRSLWATRTAANSPNSAARRGLARPGVAIDRSHPKGVLNLARWSNCAGGRRC